jgi:hypothetical protein
MLVNSWRHVGIALAMWFGQALVYRAGPGAFLDASVGGLRRDWSSLVTVLLCR